VAADNCIDTSDTAKYNPVQDVCPVIKPQGLSIEVIGGDNIVMNTNVVFQLTQEEVTAADISLFNTMALLWVLILRCD
jgi:hypothetical protein